ncbi:hypothetical protein Fmac_015095 [Flemingia macrophylla]|uniref:Uncharacterized protein n=1 Tax=Flemingia macrophylla TaxID=520843 RepID=A0ABD1MDK3_9FABA
MRGMIFKRMGITEGSQYSTWVFDLLKTSDMKSPTNEKRSSEGSHLPEGHDIHSPATV